MSKDITKNTKKPTAKEKSKAAALKQFQLELKEAGFEGEFDLSKLEKAKEELFDFFLSGVCSNTQTGTLMRLFSKVTELGLRVLEKDWNKFVEDKRKEANKAERDAQTGQLRNFLDFAESLRGIDREKLPDEKWKLWQQIYGADPVLLEREMLMTYQALEDSIGESIDSLMEDWNEAQYKLAKTEPYEDLPPIQTNVGHLKKIVKPAIKVLKKFNEPPTLFTRGDLMVRVRKNGGVIEVDKVHLADLLDRNASFLKIEKKEKGVVITPTRVPADLPPNILAKVKTDDSPTPQLDTISTVPVFTEDKTLLATEGYHPKYSTLLRLGDLGDIKTDMPINEAKALIESVFQDFPFVEKEAGLAHCFAMVLQQFARGMIKGPTPLYLIDAPTIGTGKSLLCEVVSRIITGQAAHVMPPVKNEEELEKRITAMLLEGHPVTLFDNVDTLKEHTLAAAITAEIHTGRRLGATEILNLKNNTLWCATGNNVEVLGDLPRRIIPIRLDAGVAKPYNRKSTEFTHGNLREFVLENRSRLIGAALSIILAWIKAGCPKPDSSKVLGSFEGWVDVIGGILKFIKVEGFLEGLDYIQNQAEEETNEWATVCQAWWGTHGHLPISAKDLLKVCGEHEPKLLLNLWGGRSGNSEHNYSGLSRIGFALRKKRDGVFGDYTIRDAGISSITKNKQYKLEIKNKSKNPKENPKNPTQPTQPTENAQPNKENFNGGFNSNPPNPPNPPQNNSQNGGGFKPTNKPTPENNTVSEGDSVGTVGTGGFWGDSEGDAENKNISENFEEVEKFLTAKMFDAFSHESCPESLQAAKATAEGFLAATPNVNDKERFKTALEESKAGSVEDVHRIRDGFVQEVNV